MKLNSQHNEVLTNSTKQSTFTINASAQAFRILSDGLYEHKVAAIIRELSCNAYDAHVEKGNADEPFKVILPNSLHPYFEIEDYGIGLDDEGVRTIYTSYFTSTKQNSNDAIGAFGLGSKTPFSYTNSFTIRARKNGVERVYNAYIGEDGAPCVNLMIEKETEEGSGIKITVPVKQEHFSRFHNEARFILSMFKVRPSVPDSTFEFLLDEDLARELDEGKMCVRKISGNQSSLYQNTFYAVMGGVCYGVSIDSILGRLDHNLSSYIRQIVLGNSYYSYGNKNVMFLKFDIGELEPAASRETLSMNENTEQVLANKVESAVRELIKEDQDFVDSSTHPIHAIKYIEEKYNMGSLAFGMFDYKGKNLNKWYSKTFKILNSHFTLFSLRHNTLTRSTVNRFSEISLKKDIDIVYCDTNAESGWVKYTRSHLENSRDKAVYSVKRNLSEHQMKRVEQYIGLHINWIKLSDLKDKYKPSVVVKTKGVTSKVQDKPKRVEIYGKSFRYTKGDTYIDDLGAMRVDCVKNKVFYFDDYIDYANTFKAYNGSKSIRINIGLLGRLLKSINMPDVILLKRNVNNSNKMKENKIMSINVLVDQFRKSVSSDLKSIAIQSFMRNVNIGSISVHELIEKYESKLEIEGYEGDVISSSNLNVLESVLEYDKEYEEAKNNIDYTQLDKETTEKVLERYSILPIIETRYYRTSFNEEKIQDSIKQYVSLVDSTHEEV